MSCASLAAAGGICSPASAGRAARISKSIAIAIRTTWFNAICTDPILIRPGPLPVLVHILVPVHGLWLPHLIARADHARQHGHDTREQGLAHVPIGLRNHATPVKDVQDGSALACR